MKTVRILSYNVLFGKRIDRITDWLNRFEDCEIFCFQEFPEAKITECVELLGRRPYGWKFAAAFTYKKKTFGQLTMYRKDMLSMKSHSIVPLGIHPIERRILKTTIPRTCLITNFTIHAVPFTVANVHLVGLASNRPRYAQIDLIMKELIGIKKPVILLGDFNISNLAGKKNLIDTMESHRFSGIRTYIPTYKVSLFRHQFDYVFTRECAIESVTSLRVRFSDHLPVHAHIMLP